MIAGPGCTGIVSAHAGLFGIDFFGDDDKSDLHHPRPGADAEPSAATAARLASVETPTAMRSAAAAPQGVIAPRSGGGGIPRSVSTARPVSLPRVSSAPVTRSVVIRRAPQTQTRASAPEVVVAAPRSPAVVPLAVPPPDAAEPDARPGAGAPVPPPRTPRAKDPLRSGTSSPAPAPASFRAGYAEYLRSAATADLVVAALPGVVGIAGFTLAGAYAGYRHARAAHSALLAPVPTHLLL